MKKGLIQLLINIYVDKEKYGKIIKNKGSGGNMKRVGLLAGVGILPVEFVKACHMENIEVVCIAVIPGVDPALKNLSDKYYEISAFKLEQVIRTCLDEKIDEVTMIGKVTKEWLFKNHVLPDWRTIKLLNRLRKANWKDDTITLAIVDELKKDNIEVVDQTKYLRPFMPGAQIFTKKKPTEENLQDIRLGFETAKAIGAMDLGQTVVVKNGAVMAVEAIEGTDACIKRGGTLARGNAVVVKVAKPLQDTRFDMPTVGLTTIYSMKEGGCSVLAIEAHCTLLAEREKVIKEADRLGMVIVAVEQNNL